jgi:hypothetical protein
MNEPHSRATHLFLKVTEWEEKGASAVADIAEKPILEVKTEPKSS